MSWSAYVLSLEALITDIYCWKKKKRKKKDSKAGWIPKHQLRNIGHVGNETGCAVVRLNTWKCNDFATSSSIAVCGGSIRTSKAIDATIQKQFLSDLERI